MRIYYDWELENLVKQMIEYDKSNNTLHLNNSGLQDELIITLVTLLEEYRQITTLDISFNDISDVGACALAQNNTITTLYIRLNRISSDGKKVIDKMLKRNRALKEAIKDQQFVDRTIAFYQSTANDTSYWLPIELVQMIVLLAFRDDLSHRRNDRNIRHGIDLICCNLERRSQDVGNWWQQTLKFDDQTSLRLFKTREIQIPAANQTDNHVDRDNNPFPNNK